MPTVSRRLGLLSSVLRLPSRFLHRQIHPSPRSDGQDPELQLAHHLSRGELRDARRLLDESPGGVVRWTAALSRLAAGGRVDLAEGLFALLPERNTVTYNALLSAYLAAGRIPAALSLFRRIPSPNVVSYTALLHALAAGGRSHEAFALFASMPARNAVSHNALVAGLAKAGDFTAARRALDEMPQRTAAACNALISGYAARGRMAEARELFEAMGPAADVVSWTAVIAGHARAGEVREAYDLFRNMIPRQNIVTWTAMIGGFVWNGLHDEALLLLLEMNQTSQIRPNGETFVSLIYACTGIGCVRLGKQVHGHAVVHGIGNCGQGGRLSKALIYLYSRLGPIDWAHRVFRACIRTCDAVCWHSMIEGYTRIGQLGEARRLFDEIVGADPARVTWVTIMVTWTAMVAAYFDAGDVAEARRLFDRMPERDGATWTALISGLVRNERFMEAFEAFADSRAAGVAPTGPAIAALLGAVGSASRLEIGGQLHGLTIKTRPESGHGSDIILGNALVAMYAKSGDLDAARQVFKVMESRDMVTWNSMIVALAHHGRAEEALDTLEAMEREGVAPDGVTWLGALTACAHAGMLGRGLELASSMVDCGGPIGTDHRAAVVWMLGRAGRAREAERLAAAEPGIEVWGALLGTCGLGRGIERGAGERAAKKVLELDPLNGAAHMALCHVYAAEEGGYTEDGEEVRREMGRKGVKKTPGCSWIGVRGTIHVFLCGDKSHPCTDEIYSLLDGIHCKN